MKQDALFNMVEQQIRPWNVFDKTVLQALFDVPRERFAPQGMQALAFSDVDLPLIINAIDTHETMLTPKLEARLAQELLLESTDCVLEIGTGSGYQAALLARLAQQVTTVEIDSKIAAFASENLQREHVGKVTVEVGDGHAGRAGPTVAGGAGQGLAHHGDDAARHRRRRLGLGGAVDAHGVDAAARAQHVEGGGQLLAVVGQGVDGAAHGVEGAVGIVVGEGLVVRELVSDIEQL